MLIDYTDEQKALRDELRAYFDRLFTPALREELKESEGGTPEYTRALEQMGRDGWLGIGWSKAYGGQERPVIDQFIFFDEVQRAGFPIPFLTLNTVGPALERFGTEEQKEFYLPRILKGQCHFTIGYTEPSAGTDLASLTTTAVREGDEYVINGQKVFSSLAHFADYIWLACRTCPDAPKHKGISIIIVPTNTPGVSQTPIHTMGENQTAAVYYDNVRVPVGNLVGEENKGWKLITTQLNHERVALVAVGPLQHFIQEVRQWALNTVYGDGTRVMDQPWVQRNLAYLECRTEALKLLHWQQAQRIEEGNLAPADASALKVYGSEFFVEGYRMLMEVLGEAGALKQGSEGALLEGRLARFYRALLILTFGGGTNEVQRDIIAMAGLRMPRSR